MIEQISIFVADDHLGFRQSIKDLIANNNRYFIAGEAGDGATAWEMVRVLDPEIALLDINMPGLGGLELAALIRESTLQTKVIMVTSYKEESFVSQSKDLGVSGFVLKDDFSTDLPNALRSVSRGDQFYSPAVISLLHKQSCQNENTNSLSLERLTPSELRILRLLVDEVHESEIAKQLDISPKTVGMYQASIVEKLELDGALDLVVFAREHETELKGLRLLRKDFGQ